MSDIIKELEMEQTQGKQIPEFAPGDTVVIQVKVKEGNRERLQAFEGVVIGIRNRGLNSAFTVRKVSHGEGVERTFQTYSPLIDSITVKRRGDVRRAKLYYLRERSGRSARIKEKIVRKSKKALPEALKTDTLETAAALDDILPADEDTLKGAIQDAPATDNNNAESNATDDKSQDDKE